MSQLQPPPDLLGASPLKDPSASEVVERIGSVVRMPNGRWCHEQADGSKVEVRVATTAEDAIFDAVTLGIGFYQGEPCAALASTDPGARP